MVAANAISADEPTYSAGLNDPTNAYDAPVPGFVGPDGDGFSPDSSASNYVNPLFFGWAVEQVVNYSPAPGVGLYTPLPGLTLDFSIPSKALGPVTGDNFDVVSLGDLSTTQITGGVAPGQITLQFGVPIRNRSGADLVIFENATGGTNSVFGELAYVEVSSDGEHFARFPSRSLTSSSVSAYSSIDPRKVFNLAGKHVNASGDSWGTPFDLAQLASDPLCDPLLYPGGDPPVNLNAIRYVRLVDIPGKGPFLDSQGNLINRFLDSQGNSIYDAWLTYGSGGFDLEAVGAISQNATFSSWAAQNSLPPNSESDDTDGDGLADLLEYAFANIPTISDNTTPPTVLGVAAGRLQITFRRDERAADLTYEVQASDNLSTWTTIARCESGGPVVGAEDFSPEITETSASPIASVGVIRKVGVRDVVDLSAKPRRFLRVRIVKP